MKNHTDSAESRNDFRSRDAALMGAESSTTEVVKVDWVDPLRLFSSNRFDFAAKSLYLRFLTNHIDSNWGKQVYCLHLSLWNGFFERFPPKRCEADFIDAFHRIMESAQTLTQEGFPSIIPLTSDGVPLNGAHRITTALHFHKKVACVHTEILSAQCNWNYRYFRRLADDSPHPDAEDAFDAMALELCRVLPRIAIAVIFPAAKGRDVDVERILGEHASIHYRKDVEFGPDGRVQLMRTLYEREPWLGDHGDGFAGARNKAVACFPCSRPAKFFLLAYDEPAELMRAKARVRELFDVGNHSIHITDTREEAWRAARLAFSKNSVAFVNRRPVVMMRNFETLFSEYRRAITDVPNDEDFCVEGGAVMAVCGIRDCGDFDYLHHQTPLRVGVDERIRENNGHAHYHRGRTLDDVIFDHRNHFYWQGLKFVSLENLRSWKVARGLPRDHRDIALIDASLVSGARAIISRRWRGMTKLLMRKPRSALRQRRAN